MNRRDNALATEFLAAIMGMVGWAGPRYHAAPEKPAKKCSLPSCHTMTRHNGGYCCADHCREHRAILRTSNDGGQRPAAQEANHEA